MPINTKITSINDAVEALKNSALTTKSKAAVRQLDDEAHKNPWLLIGIAALVAALFGFLLGRKSKD